MKTWDAGNGAGHLVAYKDQAITAKTIDDQKAMRVRGAFFGLDDLIFWFTVASLVLTSASIVVSYISPTFGRILGYAAMVAGIVAIAASVVNFAVQGFTMALNATKGLTLLQSIQKGFSALGSAIWDGVAHVGQFLKQGFTFFSDVFTGNFGSLGAGITNLGKFAMDGVKVMFDSAGALVKQNLTFGQMVGRSMIAAAINIPVSKGLEGLGIDPRMARLAGAFISGGVVGLGGGTTQFFQSGMQMYLLQGVSEIGLNLDLPPPVTAALSIAVNASLAGFFDPNFILRNELPNIFPSFTQQLTLGGIDLLGRSLGLDPRITELIGLPFAAAIGGVTKDLLNPNGGMTSLWQSIQNAVFSRETIGGVLSIGAGFTIDAFSLDESLTSSFLSRLSVGLLKDFIQTGGRTNVFESLTANAQKSLRHFLDPNILPQLFAAVSEKGLATAFEEYAISVLRQDTIEDFSEGGLSFAQQITLAMQNAQDSNCGGRPCRSIHIGKNDKLITYEYFYENGKFQIYGVQEIVDGFDREFVFETDSNGNITGVMVLVRDDQGQVITERKLTGDVRDTIQFTDWNGDVYAEISISETGEFEFANYNLGVSGDISRYGQVELSYQIPDLEEDFGGLIQQFNATNLTPAQKRQVVCFSVGNGFWNQHRSKDEISDLAKALLQNLTGDLARNGTPPAILYENGHIAVDGGGNILTTASLPITLYEETGLIGNGLKWMCETWFGCNDMKEEIVSEVTHYMDVLRANGFDPSQMNLVHFSHSGNFQPMIKALEDPRLAELNLKTMIVYGGPYAGDGVINNTNLDTIIRIHGSKDSVPLLGDRQFSGVDSAGNLRPVTNYNIEILDAGHSDFSCASGPNSDACSDFINQQTNLFTRDLELIANDRDFLARFLSEETVGIKIENGLIKLDPRKYISPFGERQ
jgi:hypothetical protein